MSVAIPPEHPPPKAQAAAMELPPAKAQNTAAMATTSAGLLFSLFGCLYDLDVLLCLGLTSLVITVVLVFLSRQHIAEAQKHLAEHIDESRIYGEELEVLLTNLRSRGGEEPA